MPCMDGGSSYDDLKRAEKPRRIKGFSSTEKKAMQDRLDRATRVACELGRLCTELAMSEEARKWLEEHAEVDRKRVLREKALAKLTDEEKKALNL